MASSNAGETSAIQLPLLPGVRRQVMPTLQSIGTTRYSSAPFPITEIGLRKSKGIISLENNSARDEGVIDNGLEEEVEEEEEEEMSRIPPLPSQRSSNLAPSPSSKTGGGPSSTVAPPKRKIHKTIIKPVGPGRIKLDPLKKPAAPKGSPLSLSNNNNLEDSIASMALNNNNGSSYESPVEDATATQQQAPGGSEKPSSDNGNIHHTHVSAHIEKIDPAAWHKYAGKVCHFYAYFKEDVTEDSRETHRVRKAVVSYYLADNTIQISEPKSQNSGLPQGMFLKRSQVYGDHGLLQPLDFMIGHVVNVAGRDFHTVDCDQRTREFMEQELKVKVPYPEQYPEDQYAGLRRQIELEGTDPRRSAKIANGKVTGSRRVNSKLKQYLKYENRVLCFNCIWRNNHLRGQIERFELHYFLGDDTIEITNCHKKNSGFDNFPLLLKRQRVPFETLFVPSGQETPRGFEREKIDFVQKEHIRCGGRLKVYGRDLEIQSCDKFTRDFYRDELGIEQVLLEEHSEGEQAAKGVDKHSGAPKSDGKKAVSPTVRDRHSKDALRFTAKIKDPSCPHDADREFIVTYFLADNSLAIFEPPVPNSGIVGGRYLERGKYETVIASPNSSALISRPITFEDLRVGGSLSLRTGASATAATPSFELTRADVFTERFLTDFREKQSREAVGEL